MREVIGDEIWYSAHDTRVGPFTLTQEKESLSFDDDIANKLGVELHDVAVAHLASAGNEAQRVKLLKEALTKIEKGDAFSFQRRLQTSC